jgi:hypothetical protein
MTRSPLVFISHKHSDALIADEVRKWIFKWTLRKVEVYQSSSPDARGPDIARSLTAELNRALWTAGSVILIYTTEEQDWSWCMFECGVATIPESPDTRIVVFQCSDDPPRVFQDKVRVDVRSIKDVTKFATQFLTDPKFFPGLGAAVAPALRPEHTEVQEAALELFNELTKVLPSTPVAEWAAQPLLRLQLTEDVVHEVATGALDAGEEHAAFDHAQIIGLYQQASQIFGVADLPPGANFGWLVGRWKSAYPDVPLHWAIDLRRQVREASTGGIPGLRWAYLRELGGNDRYAPVLSRVRRVPALKSVQFDIHLLPYDRLMATSARERMVARDQMEVVNLDHTPADQLKLLWLTSHFDKHRLNRIPVFDGGDRPLLIVHRSMINSYIVRKVAGGAAASLADITLAQLLAEEPELKRLFETSFDVVAEDARLNEVRTKMAANAECYDVFVTATGKRDKPVIGWLTDVIVAQTLGLG